MIILFTNDTSKYIIINRQIMDPYRTTLIYIKPKNQHNSILLLTRGRLRYICICNGIIGFW